MSLSLEPPAEANAIPPKQSGNSYWIVTHFWHCYTIEDFLGCKSFRNDFYLKLILAFGSPNASIQIPVCNKKKKKNPVTPVNLFWICGSCRFMILFIIFVVSGSCAAVWGGLIEKTWIFLVLRNCTIINRDWLVLTSDRVNICRGSRWFLGLAQLRRPRPV